jgi:hypothetical protein
MLPRHSRAGGMDHIGFNSPRPQPPRQPEAVPAEFERDGDPLDFLSRLDRFIPPAQQQPERFVFLIRAGQLLGGTALKTRHYPPNPPGFQAQLDNGNQGLALLKRRARFAGVKTVPDYAVASANFSSPYGIGCVLRDTFASRAIMVSSPYLRLKRYSNSARYRGTCLARTAL